MVSFLAWLQGIVQDGALKWHSPDNTLITGNMAAFKKDLKQLYSSQKPMTSFFATLRANGFELVSSKHPIKISHPKLTDLPDCLFPQEFLDSWKKLEKAQSPYN
ncbi:hypothetical protein Pst134EB_033319 [Puccinia striiformis f. sp. tritici]|uniref:HSF-type DNA-binding domain-containing protein n=1 Tax=Puccinia striiformis TaxID=27350 RepID=A0A2S4VMF9_9BASI|nr:hypothetical protein Pst134EB_033319 [Puccinia striiformis f. sp. tritici]POW10706.1 hypothetical protein PSTT_05917 [Puccinia striiformis]